MAEGFTRIKKHSKNLKIHYLPSARTDLGGGLQSYKWEALCWQAVILTGDFNYPVIFWESKVAGCKQLRRLLKWAENNFLVQVLDKLTRGEVLFNLVLVRADELNNAVKTGGSLGYCDHILVDFMISRNTDLTKKRSQDSKIQKTKLKKLVDEIP